MRFQPNLSQKGLFFVCVPLILQLMFVACLFNLNNDAEAAAARADKARQISDYINQLEKDIFEIVQSVHGDQLFDGDFKNDEYNRAIRDTRMTFQLLENQVMDDKPTLVLVSNAKIAGDQAINLLETARKDYLDGKLPPRSEERQEVFRQMHKYLKVMVSPDVLNIGKRAKELAQKKPEQQAAYREQLRNILLACVLLNVFLTIVLALFFSRNIIRRLNIMNDNSFRLASEKPLNARFNGNDEIDSLDHMFHAMADSLIDAARKERAIIENARDVICSLDQKGTFLAVSPACEKVFGYLPTELMGSRFINIVYRDDVDHTLEQLKYVMTGIAEPFEMRLQRKNGQIIDVEWSAAWNQSEQTMFCVAHDITERKQAERLRQEVVAMVSHDLKTPLSTIRSFLEMLDAGMFGELNERGQQLLALADRSSGRMLTLIKDLLEIEKMESGILELRKTEVPLSNIFEQSLHAVAASAAEFGVTLESEPTTILAYADSDRIVQIIVNLLSNAVKFSPKGGVVKLAAHKTAGYIVVQVSDQGRGIPAHLTSAIFDRFKQVQESDATEKGGSGLGLAICKALVELHGGDIKVESDIDKGSVFSLRLPFDDTTSSSDAVMECESDATARSAQSRLTA